MQPFSFRRKVTSCLPLSTNRLSIKDISDENLKVVRGWFSSNDHLAVSYYHTDKSIPSDFLPALFSEDFKKREDYICLALTVKDKLIGISELFYYNSLEKSCEVGFMLRSASEYSYIILSDLLFLLANLLFQCLELNCVYIAIDKNNKKLMRLLRSYKGELSQRTILNPMELEFKLKRKSVMQKYYKLSSNEGNKLSSSSNFSLKAILKNGFFNCS